MAGSLNDKFTRVTDSDTGRPVISTLASSKSVGATSVTIGDATNWTTTTKVHFSIYTTLNVAGSTVKDTSSQTDWIGTLSGTTISNVSLTGGTDRTYNAGSIVEMTPSSKWAKDLFDGLSVVHNTDGTLKPNVINATNLLSDSVITNSKIADNSITNAKLDPSIGGAWQSWTPTFTNLTLGTGTVDAKFNQIGKTVNYRIMVTLKSSTVGTGVQFSLPTAVNTGLTANEGAVIGNARFLDAGLAAYYGLCKIYSTTTAEVRVLTGNGSYVGGAAVTATAPFTWGDNDAFMVTGTYEAA